MADPDDEEEEVGVSEYQTLEDLVREAKEAKEQEARDKVVCYNGKISAVVPKIFVQAEMESKIKEQAAYLASLKGADQRMSASQLMHSHGNPYGRGDSYPYGPAGKGLF